MSIIQQFTVFRQRFENKNGSECAREHTQTHSNTYTHTSKQTYTHTHAHTQTYTHTHTRARARARTFGHTHTRTRASACAHKCINRTILYSVHLNCDVNTIHRLEVDTNRLRLCSRHLIVKLSSHPLQNAVMPMYRNLLYLFAIVHPHYQNGIQNTVIPADHVITGEPG